MGDSSGSNMGEKLWGGRFVEGLNPVMDIFNRSITFDKQLWDVDIKGSIAYAKALEKCGLITSEESAKLFLGLSQISEEWASNSFIIKDDEDIHSANERRLKEIIGNEIGGKLHVGRSRNDQVATDVRLWLREQSTVLKSLLISFTKICCERAKSEIDILMPGYTHLQRAQAIRWSHWLLSYAWYFHNDVDKLDDIISRMNICPLGSGALAGNPFNIDRDFLAKELGFSGCTPNSLLAVSDRDFIAEFLFWGALVATHFSKWAEDLLLYSTKEFGFVTIADAFCTGSSLMPQKKNADSLELIRGKSGRLIGNCMAILVVLKGLPSTFNKDLQEDKEPLFDSYKTLIELIQVACGTLETLKIHKEVCFTALSPDMFATDVAYYLVRKGVAFRDAHKIAGEVVALAEKEKCTITELSLSQLKTLSEHFGEDISSLWNYEASVQQYQAFGGTARENVAIQVQQLEQWISDSETLTTQV
ncbi:Argininosuccinate lyase like protein [Argiope bruennichi]|uniref:Arginosuccinase n=1 Tax=Argiope bruennichi TaxID=94029 RepID=A0A8T0E892_ARGBR|nr:Argininosuccinate lyase like protein [Argiope bruennichi]